MTSINHEMYGNFDKDGNPIIYSVYSGRRQANIWEGHFWELENAEKCAFYASRNAHEAIVKNHKGKTISRYCDLVKYAENKEKV